MSRAKPECYVFTFTSLVIDYGAKRPASPFRVYSGLVGDRAEVGLSR